MRHLFKYNENFKEENKSFFSDKIDWKLVRFIQDILTEFWDKEMDISLNVNVDGLSIYTCQYDDEEGKDTEHFTSDEQGVTTYYCYKCIDNYRKYGGMTYEIQINRGEDGSKYAEIFDRIKSKLEAKYNILYVIGAAYALTFKKYSLR